MIKASDLLRKIFMIEIDKSIAITYEVDLHRGMVKAEGVEDHQRLLEALTLLKQIQPPYTPESLLAQVAGLPVPPSPTAEKNSLTLSQLLDKYLLLKQLESASVLALKHSVKEFQLFFKSKCYISDILVSDITKYQEFLATSKKNTARTIDTKISHLKLLLNFAIKQGYLIGKNPAEGKSLLTKRQKLTGGYLIFEMDEIKQIFTSNYFKSEKNADKDYYYTLLLALFTGCRSSELTSLAKSQIKLSESGHNFILIRDSKTSAGKREIPIPKEIFDHGFLEFIKDKSESDMIFRYISREGKGSGNAVGKKFSRHLEELKIARGTLVLHSLRKFLNDYFMKNGIEFEARCQFFGHEIESVNVATYSKKFGIDQMVALINPVQQNILKLIELK